MGVYGFLMAVVDQEPKQIVMPASVSFGWAIDADEITQKDTKMDRGHLSFIIVSVDQRQKKEKKNLSFFLMKL